MVTAINRYAIDHTPQAENVVILAPKYCELCGLPFVTDELQARAPGDLLPMQRAAGKRPPIICKHCKQSGKNFLFLIDEAKEMLRVAGEIRDEREARDAKIHVQVLEEQRLAQQRRAQREPMKRDEPRKFRFAKWREPLMKAFRERGELTAREIATIIGVQPGAPASQIYIVPARVRSAGVPIVVVREEKYFNTGARGNRRKRYFGLSTAQELAPLTPPKDEVTHQFMREVQA